jgi:hypothetical protein
MKKLRFILVILAVFFFAGAAWTQDDTSMPQEPDKTPRAQAGSQEPMDEAAPPEDAFPPLCVSGVIPSEGKPLAVINGEIMEEGALVDGARVIAITEQGVTFEYQDKAVTRQIGEECRPVKSVLPAKVASIAKTESAKILRQPPTRFSSQREFHHDLSPGQAAAVAAAVGVAWLIGLIVYIYIALSLQVIANKTGTDYAWLAWIPLLNIYLMCKIAGKSMFFLFLFFIPFINIIAIILVWMGIAEARGKPGWLGILMVVPIVSLIIPGYLAFSD